MEFHWPSGRTTRSRASLSHVVTGRARSAVCAERDGPQQIALLPRKGQRSGPHEQVLFHEKQVVAAVRVVVDVIALPVGGPFREVVEAQGEVLVLFRGIRDAVLLPGPQQHAVASRERAPGIRSTAAVRRRGATKPNEKSPTREVPAVEEGDEPGLIERHRLHRRQVEGQLAPARGIPVLLQEVRQDVRTLLLADAVRHGRHRFQLAEQVVQGGIYAAAVVLLVDDVRAAQIARHHDVLCDDEPARIEFGLSRIRFGRVTTGAVRVEQHPSARRLHLRVVRSRPVRRGLLGPTRLRRGDGRQEREAGRRTGSGGREAHEGPPCLAGFTAGRTSVPGRAP